MVNSFKYVIENGGICKDSDYDYLGYVSFECSGTAWSTIRPKCSA